MHVNVAWMILSHQKKVKVCRRSSTLRDEGSELIGSIFGGGNCLCLSVCS